MDIIDLANAHAELFRHNSLRQLDMAKQAGTPEMALYIDGVRCCLDCEVPIPAGRLEASPDAVRCVECQERHERRSL